jgi:hypothetical protein
MSRYQRGQRIHLTLDTASAPDALPVATIRRDGSATIVASFTMALPRPPHGYRKFFASFVVGAGFSLGTYQVEFAYSVAGTPYERSGSFEVVAGGDAAGDVISLHASTRPEGHYVLAQLSSGRLVRGRNPHL